MRTVGSAPEARLAPLHAITGAPGSGKTTLLPELVRLGDGLIVMDIDELLEDGALLGMPIARPEADAHADWPAYDRLWSRITAMARRSGHPVVLLCPNTPDERPDVSGWLLLDCADSTRIARLRARGWDAARIDEALADAAEARALVSYVVRTDDLDPTAVAERVLARLGGRGPSTARE